MSRAANQTAGPSLNKTQKKQLGGNDVFSSASRRARSAIHQRDFRKPAAPHTALNHRGHFLHSVHWRKCTRRRRHQQHRQIQVHQSPLQLYVCSLCIEQSTCSERESARRSILFRSVAFFAPRLATFFATNDVLVLLIHQSVCALLPVGGDFNQLWRESAVIDFLHCWWCSVYLYELNEHVSSYNGFR
jgi:hypothetical protein